VRSPSSCPDASSMSLILLCLSCSRASPPGLCPSALAWVGFARVGSHPASSLSHWAATPDHKSSVPATNPSSDSSRIDQHGRPLPDEYRHAVLPNPCKINLDAFVIADHPVITRILREGWLTHISLTALTIEKCCTASFLDYARPLEQGKKTQIMLNAVAEASIPLKDWLNAWPHFCLHIGRHLKATNPQSIADTFVAHFEGIMNHYDFKSLYWLYLEYDIHVRTLWESRLGQFSPGIFYE
jgi:hypothetical protein